MLRRITFSPDESYHIYNRGVDKRQIFFDTKDHERFIKLLFIANNTEPIRFEEVKNKKLKDIKRKKQLVSIGAWCIMPNHFHLLLKEKEDGGITIFMKKLLTGYSMYFNTKHQRRGALFEGRFKAQHLDNDNYLKHQYSYIHLNPIGIIDKDWKNKKINNLNEAKKYIENYKYSSYFDYAKESERDEVLILSKEAFPKYFETKSDFKDLLESWLSQP